MSLDLGRALRRLAHPRSRRSRLWACVYCGAFTEASADSNGPAPPQRAD